MPSRERTGVLLAGGGSTRFGGHPKGIVAFGNGRLADRPLRALMDVCDDVLVAANDPDAARWFPFHRVVGDIEPGRSAMGALVTALHGARSEVVVVCAWDMPFVTADLLDSLATVVEQGASCCVPVHADGSSEPLCAAYRRSVCLPAAVQVMVLYDEQAARALHPYVEGAAWRVDEHLAPHDAARIFSNVNTPDDLEAAERLLPHGGTPSQPVTTRERMS